MRDVVIGIHSMWKLRRVRGQETGAWNKLYQEHGDHPVFERFPGACPLTQRYEDEDRTEKEDKAIQLVEYCRIIHAS